MKGREKPQEQRDPVKLCHIPHPVCEFPFLQQPAALLGLVMGSAQGRVPWTVSWIRPLSSPYELIA